MILYMTHKFVKDVFIMAPVLFIKKLSENLSGK